MRVSYSEEYYAPIPLEHTFPIRKFPALHRYLISQKIIAESDVIKPSLVEMSSLLSVHTPRYAAGVINGSLTEKEVRRLGLPWSSALAVRSQLAVQGTINAAIMALHDGIAGNLAGGTHHAMADHGEGFCVFNDVAVAVYVLQKSCRARNILIIDCYVHQGNGMAMLLSGNENVFTFSMHGERNYPFKKPPSTLDIGLQNGKKDDKYLKGTSNNSV